MKSKYQNTRENLANENNNKLMIIILLIISNFGLVGLAIYLSFNIQVTINPGITSPTTMKRGQIDKTNAYSIAERLMMNLYLWKDDGRKDYKDNIGYLDNYLSERCKQYLESDFQKRLKNGELGNRVRQLNPLQFEYTNDLVKEFPPNKWLVKLNFHLQETVNGTPIKNGHYVWNVPVLRDQSNPLNKFGMVIDCPFENNSPYRVEEYRDE